MRILVLGGGSFVGRAIAGTALSRDHEVTTFTRSTLPLGGANGRIEMVFGDRTKPGAFDFASGRQWDAVFDTWMGAPRVVQEGVAVLREHVPYYGFVSSCSVYQGDPLLPGVNESASTVDADPSADVTDYASNKRGAELAILDAFGIDASLLARAGIILGPYENVGRLPWWLNRISRGGEVLAPGPKDLPLQYIDARDLAEWMISSAEHSAGGIFNAISPIGHTTMSRLLEICRHVTRSSAQFTWVTPEFLEEQGIEEWTEMPLWIQPDNYGLFKIDTSRAAGAGLSCRPVDETVADTWDWMMTEAQTQIPAGKASCGLDAEKESLALGEWAKQER